MNAQLDLPRSVQTPLRWDNRFHRMGACFYTPLAPQPVPIPYWVGRSAAVARQLVLEDAWMASDDLL